jgi:hypothetical protein
VRPIIAQKSCTFQVYNNQKAKAAIKAQQISFAGKNMTVLAWLEYEHDSLQVFCILFDQLVAK